MSITQQTTTAKTDHSRRNTILRRSLLIIPCGLLIVGGGYLGLRLRTPENQMAHGTLLLGQDQGGKTIDEVRESLQKWAEEQKKRPVRLKFPEEAKVSEKWTRKASELGLGIDVEKTLAEATNTGKPDLLTELKQLIGQKRQVNIPVVMQTDDVMLQRFLKTKVAPVINQKPVNARFMLMRKGGFGTVSEKPGRTMDVAMAADTLKKAWKESFVAQQPPAEVTTETKPDETTPVTPPTETTLEDALEVELAVKTVQPKVTKEELQDINGVIGSKTSYVGGTTSRLGNIRIAARRINGTLLMPGDVFSYNTIVGPRSESAGYREAPILVRGRHETGVAGGICQTSGTLFNAVLYSGLKIVERSPHSTVIAYLPTGLDATVSYGAIDFRFQNNTTAPIYISSSLSGRTLNFTLFGKKVPGRKVSLIQTSYSRQRSYTTTIRDRSKHAGYYAVQEGGHSGCRVAWKRVIRENGIVVSEDTIRSTYRPVPTIVVVGAGAPKAKPVSSKKTKPAGQNTGADPDLVPGTETNPAAP